MGINSNIPDEATVKTLRNVTQYSNSLTSRFNPSVWGHLNPSSYCDVGRFFYRVFKF